MIGVTLCSDTGICGHWQDGCAECDNNYKQSKDSFLSDENFKTKDWIKNIEIVRYNTKKNIFYIIFANGIMSIENVALVSN